jgi:hypothetical protein
VDDRAQVELSFRHDRLRAEPDHPADSSHAHILGIPPAGASQSELIQDLLAESIIAHFFAVSDE